MRKVIPLLICRHLYDEKKKDAPTAGGYLNIVIGEAHNILSNLSSRESEAWKDYRLATFEEIVKEGRKFGVFVTIASQRPHDISETIISQLHNYVLHRLVNNLDILAIERAVAFLDRVSFESLPILPTGSCVLSGVSTQVPLIVDVDALQPPFEPNSPTMVLVEGWSGQLARLPSDDESGIGEITGDMRRRESVEARSFVSDAPVSSADDFADPSGSTPTTFSDEPPF